MKRVTRDANTDSGRGSGHETGDRTSDDEGNASPTPPRRVTFVVATRVPCMAAQEQKKETGGLLFLLAGVAGFVFLLTIVVIWALAYGPLS